jgi:dipeptidyl aminopeptidase/acylaminoacyl peptidase
LLTPGAFEVEDVSLSPDLKSVVYSSNQDDIDRRHIWRVPASGGAPVALTKGTGIETAAVTSSDGKMIAILRSDAHVPMRPAIIASRSDIHDIAAEAIPADFPAAQLVTPQQVIFPAADGMPIHGQLFLPANDATGRHPAAIFFHGGSERQMLLGWHYMDYYSNAYAMNQYLASRGYVVLSVNYRSGIGYGLNFREALNYGATGASEYNDVQGAGLYLRSRSDVEPNRIGVWGGSYGGYLTALALARSSDLFAAGVDMHGVHNWNEELKNWGPYDPAGNSEFARLAWESSPLASIKNWRSPVLLIHGDDDRNVPFSETVNLADALRQQGVHFEELIFPDEIHGFLLHKSWLAAYGAAAEFFDRQLK